MDPVNWTWQQGADLEMSMVYNEGPEGEEEPINLTGYSLRMDVVYEGERLFTFNSDDIPGDTEVDVVGPADNEVVLGTAGEINVVVPRSVTLPAGPVGVALGTEASVVLDYDMFLRNTLDKQQKIMRGSITVEKSYTLWQ